MTKITFEGSSTGAVKAIQDLAKAIADIPKGLELSSKEAKKLEDAALRVTKSNQTPLEKYNRYLQETAKLVAAGKLSHEEAAKAAERYGKQLENASKHHEHAFGAEALENVGKMIAGCFAAEKVIEGVAEAFKEVTEAGKKAGEAVQTGLGGFGELGAAGGGKSDIAFARRLVREGVAKSPEQAAGIATAFRKSGLEGADREAVFHVGEQKFVRPENLGEFAFAAKEVQRIFGPKAGSIENISAKLIQAARDAKSSPEDIGRLTGKFGNEAITAGASLDEALAAEVAIGQTSASPKQAVSRTEKFFAGLLTKKGGKKFASFADALAKGKGLTDEERASFNAEVPGITGASKLGENPIFDEDAVLSTAKGAEEAKGRLAQQDEDLYGVRANIIGEIRTDIDAYRRKNYPIGGPLTQPFLAVGRYGADFFPGSDSEITSLSEGDRSNLSEKTQRDIAEYLRRIEQNQRSPARAPVGRAE